MPDRGRALDARSCAHADHKNDFRDAEAIAEAVQRPTMDRIQTQFAWIVLSMGDEFISVSASFAATTLSSSDDALDDTLHRADAALMGRKLPT